MASMTEPTKIWWLMAVYGWFLSRMGTTCYKFKLNNSTQLRLIDMICYLPSFSRCVIKLHNFCEFGQQKQVYRHIGYKQIDAYFQPEYFLANREWCIVI